jgi:3-oxoacyl-ACP reductase-like protein
MNKIFHRKAPAPAAAPRPAPTVPAPQAAPAAQAAPAQAPAQPVDVEAVLTEMAAEKGGGGNWRTSIVDLLKLLDLDSSLDARKALGQELGVHAGADGSAGQNIALYKAVMRKLAENGGRVPDSLKD